MYISYEGWGPEWNEWVHMTTDRILPLHTCTRVVKCIATGPKLSNFPALVTLRHGTDPQGLAGLREEKKVYVEFFNSSNKKNRMCVWLDRHLVKPLSQRPKELSKTAQRALATQQQATCLPITWKFETDGTVVARSDAHSTHAKVMQLNIADLRKLFHENSAERSKLRFHVDNKRRVSNSGESKSGSKKPKVQANVIVEPPKPVKVPPTKSLPETERLPTPPAPSDVVLPVPALTKKFSMHDWIIEAYRELRKPAASN